jgi:hypothetical protein
MVFMAAKDSTMRANPFLLSGTYNIQRLIMDLAKISGLTKNKL